MGTKMTITATLNKTLPNVMPKVFSFANYIVTSFMVINVIFLGKALYELLVIQNYQGNELIPLLGVGIGFTLHAFSLCVSNTLGRLEWSYNESMSKHTHK
jgi:hypothetical protein